MKDPETWADYQEAFDL